MMAVVRVHITPIKRRRSASVRKRRRDVERRRGRGVMSRRRCYHRPGGILRLERYVRFIDNYTKQHPR
jgi:hypothetical protein